MQTHASLTLFAPIFTLVSVLALALPASADTINLMWDPNPESQVSGYIVHVGTQPGVHSQHVDVGLTTTWSYASAVAGQQYCFTVSAYFAGPVEGPRSSEVCGFSNAPPALVNPGSQSSTVGQADSLQLAGSDPKEVNSWDAPNRLVVKAISAPAVEDGRATLNLPPLSFTVLSTRVA